jgi:hypothetical protein
MFKIVLTSNPVKGIQKNDLETYLSVATKIAKLHPAGCALPSGNPSRLVNLNCTITHGRVSTLDLTHKLFAHRRCSQCSSNHTI